MNTDQEIKYNKLDIKNVILPEIKKQKSKKNFTYLPIRYKNADNEIQKLYIQTPRMFSPGGAQCFKKEEVLASGQELKYSISLSLDSKNDKINIFTSFLTDLDSYICNYVADNKEWLSVLNVRLKNKRDNKPKTKDDILDDIENNKYNAIVKEPNNDIYDPLLRVKFAKKNGKYQSLCNIGLDLIEVTDDNIETLFHKALRITSVIHVSHLWVVNGRFGVTIKLMTGKVYPKNTYKSKPIQESDDENDNENEQNEQNEVSNNSNDQTETPPYSPTPPPVINNN